MAAAALQYPADNVSATAKTQGIERDFALWTDQKINVFSLHFSLPFNVITNVSAISDVW